ncbi:MAG: glutaminase A [Balneola sp.]|nr:MAG: glutaminase A [Balneola sp.]
MLTTENIENKEVASLFRLLGKNKDKQVNAEKLLDLLAKNGVLSDDPRLQGLIDKLQTKVDDQIGKVIIDDQQFHDIIKNHALIKKSLKKELVIPDFQLLCKEIKNIFDETIKNKDGNIADYIPQLARINPEHYAVSICTIDGQRYSLGDFDKNFCLQSSCKPINYCIALEELGEEKVHQHIGREPSGQSFNELTLNSKGLPHNPMINAGAIMSCALIGQDLDIADRFDRVNKTWSQLNGNKPVYFNNAVYLSERQTADRNFALAYFMRENNAFPETTNLNDILEFYFQCCSIESCTKDLSVAAATLANAGTNPLTGEAIFNPLTVQNCLSLMLSCGMYDSSGEFAFKIGIPAKSGVSGALMVVIPNVMGISIWSPRLDANGNTVRGVEFCNKLVEKFSFHHYDSLTGHSHKLNPRNNHKGNQVAKMVSLIWAASSGDMDELLRLEAEGVNLNIADYDGRTPLHLAVSENQFEVVKYLIENGVDLSPVDRWGGIPLTDAKKSGNKKIQNLLEVALKKLDKKENQN